MTLIYILLVILAVIIVGAILLQQGKGSDLGSAFGGGSSDSLFGPLGPTNFLSNLVWGLITVFFILALMSAYLSKQELTLNTQEDQTKRVDTQPPEE
tara:strand:- start:31 stop:321 length:291 start_codon:yes stop_codon:yes gene_type:complete